jgi:hypothetical protein
MSNGQWSDGRLMLTLWPMKEWLIDVEAVADERVAD